MNDYQLKTLITDIFRNSPKLQELHKKGLISYADTWDLQDLAVKLARADDLLSD